MEERLQKILSSRGIASRRKAEELIQGGHVSVNGIRASLGDKADPEKDIIKVNGARIPGKGDLVYIMLNKPRGYITSMSDEKGRPTVVDLTSDVGVRVYPVGRLDWDSEGLLLLTNDGEFANIVAHPSNNKVKSYVVTVVGNVERALESLRSPMVIDGYKIRPARVNVIGENKLLIKIHEGRNRQVRKMCAASGLEVLTLKRTAIGHVELGRLKTGTWRYLTAREIESLKGHELQK
ncbi:MAG: rRNA pseudouridine synthase [Ruminococcaceae bacterium]|nr:rRNA pseudouridine synthase [Oscillospiraceae bacterium]